MTGLRKMPVHLYRMIALCVQGPIPEVAEMRRVVHQLGRSLQPGHVKVVADRARRGDACHDRGECTYTVAHFG